MAKSTKPEDQYADLKALLTEEELATLMKLTGQDQGGGSGNRIPVVKISYKERPDAKGNKVAKGNFVVGQKSAMVDGKKVLQDVGTDLGETLKAVILKVGQQWSYWSEDKKQCCNSQIVTERGEIPVGSNLKNRCNDGSCPRRKVGIDKKDRCAAQYIAYLRLPAGTKLPDGTDCPIAAFYVKGTSFKPFQTFLQEDMKGIPSIAVVTEIGTTVEEQGSTIYYVCNFKKGVVVPAEVFKENFALVADVDKQLLDYKTEQGRKQITEKTKDTVVLGSDSKEGAGARTVVDDDSIPW